MGGALLGVVVGCSGRMRSPHAGARSSGVPNTGGSAGRAAAGGASFEAGAGGSRGGSFGTAGSSSLGGSSPSAGGEAGAPTDCTTGVPPTSQIPRLTGSQYDRTIHELLGLTTLSASGEGSPSSLLAPDQSGSISDLGWSAYQLVGEKVAAQVMADPTLRANFMRCTPAPDDATCFHDTIVEFGRRAFRRPLAADEVAGFDALVAKGPQITEHGTGDEIAETLLYAFLVSPSFLQRAEMTEVADDDGHYVLSSYEVAQRLSYLLWGSAPDAVLDAAADAGELATPEQILAQAERMLADPRARDQVATFHRYYLGMGASTLWDGFDHDTARFPLFTKDLVPAMRAETERLFDSVVFDHDGEFRDLLLTGQAFVTAGTAPLYGLDPTSFGPELTEATLDASERPGFLTRLAFLSAFSYSDRTSPIRRGAFVNEKVIGFQVGSEPLGDTDPPLVSDPSLDTNRKQTEALTAGASCTGCHGPYVNPPGFVLEAFDAVGARQTVEATTGAPIDTAADVMVEEGESVHVTSPIELMQAIAGSSQAQRRYASKWVSFAYGRENDPDDACTVEELSAKVRSGSYPILRLVADLTQPVSFRTRAVDHEQ